nr:hypothetical protein [Bacteroides intestinalis]
MKTKLLLATICLPALFAACTADEFVDQQQVNLNRETINLTLINQVLISVTQKQEWELQKEMGAH